MKLMNYKRIPCCIFFLLSLSSCSAQNLSKKQWLQDLDVLQTAIYQKHISPFWKHPRSEFETAFTSLRNTINNADESSLQPEKITTGFAQVLALTADGHSGVSTKSRAEIFGLYQYNVSWFPEGLFLTRVEESKKDLLGSRIIKIDDTPVEEAKKRVATVSTSFHEQGFKRFSP